MLGIWFPMLCASCFLLSCAAQTYDSSSMKYSPKGAVLQIEYAKEAVIRKGGPIIGLKTSSGIVIVSIRLREATMLRAGLPAHSVFRQRIQERFDNGGKGKEVSMEHSEEELLLNELFHRNRKTYLLDISESICLSVTGILSDAQALVDAAKSIINEYRSTYDTCISCEVLCDALSDALHAQTRTKGTRPLALAAVLGGYNEMTNEMQLFSIDTEGSYTGHNACYIGSSSTEKSSNILDELECIIKDDNSRGDEDIEKQWDRLRSKLIEVFKVNANKEGTTGDNKDDKESLETGEAEVDMLDFEVYLGKRTADNINSNKGIRWRRVSLLSPSLKSK